MNTDENKAAPNAPIAERIIEDLPIDDSKDADVNGGGIERGISSPVGSTGNIVPGSP